MLKSTRSKNRLLLSITISATIALFFIKPIAQNPCYHLFADQRTIFSIEHFWNVVSNVPFLIFGLIGIFFTVNNNRKMNLPINSVTFYLGIFLTGIGSIYYHHEPCSETLVWDRLPMTISFMAFFTLIIGDYICIATGKKILFPLILLGFISIIYWQMTKSKGQEDLRFYALIQFLPMVLIPVILILYKNQNQNIKTYWLILLVYFIAKACEASDEIIFTNIKLISGHTLKHFAAALVPVLFFYRQQKNALNEKF